MKKQKMLIVSIVLNLALTAMFVIAEPNGPSAWSVGNSERGGIESVAPSSASAMAGNITAITMNATAITKNWQGYFGNITGKITLDNANNWTLYDWSVANPTGFVFASRASSITWINISCFNYSGSGGSPNLTTEEITYMGAAAADSDGLDETFAIADHPELNIGSVSITQNTCNSTYLYVNDTSQSTDFREVLLTDDSGTNAVVYTAILEPTVHGFNNDTMDFEMIVAENGHGNDVADTYNFWVELT